MNDAPVAILTFYRFVDIDDPERLRAELEAEAIAADLRGTILLAREGINATLAGPEVALDDFWQGLTARALCRAHLSAVPSARRQHRIPAAQS